MTARQSIVEIDVTSQPVAEALRLIVQQLPPGRAIQQALLVPERAGQLLLVVLIGAAGAWSQVPGP